MEHGDSYWEWRDQLLKHPDGRAVGGERCVQCDGEVPANAHWKQRDRHVCSSRCNTNLSRKFGRQLNKLGEDGFDLAKPSSTPDPRDAFPEPIEFLMIGHDDGTVEFGHLGFSPRPGDSVVRYGVTTYYGEIGSDIALRLTSGVTPSVVGLSHESGWLAIIGADHFGRTDRTVWGTYSPSGERFEHDHIFEHEGRAIRLTSETVNDVDDAGRDVVWMTHVFAPTNAGHPSRVWTDAYREKSERLRRTSSSRARHARRVRLDDATIERFDPQEIYERDGWVCQLCKQPVDRELEWPDPLYPSLDHVVPLAVHGEHSRTNTQLAHWICNVRKGAQLEAPTSAHD